MTISVVSGSLRRYTLAVSCTRLLMDIDHKDSFACSSCPATAVCMPIAQKTAEFPVIPRCHNGSVA